MAVTQYPYSGAPDYALTGGPQVYQLFTPTSQADMVSRICSALLQAYHPGPPAYGWTFDSNITRGQRLALTSPQNYTAFLDVAYRSGNFGRNPVTLIWRSATGSGAVGFEQVLDFQDGYQYQIVANPANYWLSRPGVVTTVNGSACCGGIPHVDTGCGFGTEAITELWFQFSDMVNAIGDLFYHNFTPRAGLDTGGGGTFGGLISNGQQGNVNGSIVDGTPYQPGTPQILRVSSGGNDGDVGAGLASGALWSDGLPLLYPAFIGWGDPVTTGLKIRGQIYDAVIRSKKYAMDATDSWDTFDWVNYTNKYFYGSLWLIKADSSPVAGSIPIVNVAY